MKICFFTENYFKGGLDTFIINILNFWPQKKDKLLLICNKSHPGIENFKAKITRFSLITYPSYYVGNLNLFFNSNFITRVIFSLTKRVLEYLILFPFYIIFLFIFFKKSNFDRLIVINGGYPASLICRAAVFSWRLSNSKKSILNIHSNAIKPRLIFRFPENLIDHLVFSSATKIICVSSFSQQSLFSRPSFSRYAHKSSFIYNGSPDLYNKISNSKAQVFPYCLMLSTFHESKGFDFLFRAFRIVHSKLPFYKLRIYGDGSRFQKKIILDLITKYNLQSCISVYDFTSDVANLIFNSDVVLIPSQKYEAFGYTIIEAMSLSKPFISTNVGGMPEVISNSNSGFICDKNSPDDFARNILDIVNNPKLAKKMGNNGRRYYLRKYSAQVMANKYRRLLK